MPVLCKKLLRIRNLRLPWSEVQGKVTSGHCDEGQRTSHKGDLLHAFRILASILVDVPGCAGNLYHGLNDRSIGGRDFCPLLHYCFSSSRPPA